MAPTTLQGRVRSHRVVGSSFLVAGFALFVAGATSSSAPAFVRSLPIAPEVAMPFILWQLATWSVLFGWFFLKPHSGRARRGPRALARV